MASVKRQYYVFNLLITDAHFAARANPMPKNEQKSFFLELPWCCQTYALNLLWKPRTADTNNSGKTCLLFVSVHYVQIESEFSTFNFQVVC